MDYGDTPAPPVFGLDPIFGLAPGPDTDALAPAGLGLGPNRFALDSAAGSSVSTSGAVDPGGGGIRGGSEPWGDVAAGGE